VKLRKSTDTVCEEITITDCPYCYYTNEFIGADYTGEKKHCQSQKCKKRFIVGEEE